VGEDAATGELSSVSSKGLLMFPSTNTDPYLEFLDWAGQESAELVRGLAGRMVLFLVICS